MGTYIDICKEYLSSRIDLDVAPRVMARQLIRHFDGMARLRPDRAAWVVVMQDLLAVWVVLQADRSLEEIVRICHGQRNVRIRSNSDLLRILLRLLISYGKAACDQTARQYWAADARVIRALAAEKAPPGDLESYLKSKHRTLTWYVRHGAEKPQADSVPSSAFEERLEKAATELGLSIQQLCKVIDGWHLVAPLLTQSEAQASEPANHLLKREKRKPDIRPFRRNWRFSRSR